MNGRCTRRGLPLAVAAGCVLAPLSIGAALLPGAGLAADKTADKDMVATAVQKDLPIEVNVSGTFQAQDKQRIAFEPKEYSGELIIKSIIAEGTPVKTDDRLVEFEADNLTKAITKQEGDADDANVELQKAQADREALKIDQEVALKRADKELELAADAVEAEQKLVDYKTEEKVNEIRRKENSIKDQEVNFEQLKKLYESRDLHTDTETILVEREAKSLEESRIDYKKLLRDHEHFKRYTLTVDLEKKKLDLLKQEAEKRKQELKFAADLAEKDGAVRKAERKVKEAQEKLDSLNKDRQSLTITAPRDGLVFYGALDTGDMLEDVIVFGSSGIRQNLRVGGRVRTHETLLTVASMEKLSVEMKVQENDIQHLREGLKISLRPDAFPDLEIHGKIDKVDQVASRTGLLTTSQQFKVSASYDGTYPQLRAGMNCRVTVHAESIPDAVQIPVIAVFEEDGKYFCYVQDAGRPSRRPVKLGATNATSVQILEGVRPDETVYLYDPLRK